MAKAPTRKALSDRDQKRLWGKAAGHCSYKNCRRKLIRDFPESGETAVLGQHAHQKPHSERGPRGIDSQDKPWEQAIDPTGPATYENTILLCGGCHTTVDQAPKAHPVELLTQMKQAHERWVERRLEKKRNKAEKPTDHAVKIMVTEAKRKVGWCAMAIRRESQFSSRIWEGGLFGGHRRQEPRRPRVSGVKSGPPQTVFDVTIINHGTVSLKMKDFKMFADGVEIQLGGTSILRNSLKAVFKEPLETKRAQVVEVKAHHVARYLRREGHTTEVSLAFVFIDVCNEEFKHHYGQFDPMAYEDLPDSVAFEEW